jgi:MFS transporter, DHA1 family, multidrug resistance protein
MNPLNSLLGLCAVGFFARLSYALARSPVLPLFALHLGAGPEAIGWVVGISTVTGIFFKLPSGALSDVIGRRRTMLAGLVVFALTPFAYFWVKDAGLLLVIRFLHGFATAIYGPVAMAVVADVAGNRKGEMLSSFSSVTIVGNLLGAPFGGFLLFTLSRSGAPSLENFHWVYLSSGIAGCLSLLLGTKLLRGASETVTKVGLKASLERFFSGIREVVSDRRVVLTSNMEGLQNMTMGALEAFLPIYAVTVAGLNEFQAGLLWGAQVLVTIVSKPLMGRLSDRYGRKPAIVLGMMACAVSFAAIPLLTRFEFLILASLLFGLGEAFVTSSSAALVADLCQQRHFGTAMGTFGTIFDVGHASGPIVAGLLIARWGYLTAFSAMSAVLLLAIPIFILGVKVESRSPMAASEA